MHLLKDSALQAGPLPTIDGIQVPLSQQNTGISLPKSPPPALPLLTPQDKAKYMGIFQSCKPRNGLLTGGYSRILRVFIVINSKQANKLVTYS